MMAISERRYHFVEVLPALPTILNTPGLLFQRKFDGVSAEVFVDLSISIVGRGILKGRQSHYTSRFPELVNDLFSLRLPAGTNFLSELIVVSKDTGAEDLTLVQTRASREVNEELYSKLYPALMVIHDVVSVGDRNVTQLPYQERLALLRPYITGKSSRCVIIRHNTDGKAEWDAVEKYKLEGIVIRDPAAPLGSGVWKLKRELTEDVYCTGEFTPSVSDSLSSHEYISNGQKKAGLFANLICYQRTPEGKEVNVCNVGGGFGLLDRVSIQQKLDAKQVTRETPLVLEVKANSRYEDGKLRHPTYLRLRDDKPWSQCVFNWTH